MAIKFGKASAAGVANALNYWTEKRDKAEAEAKAEQDQRIAQQFAANMYTTQLSTLRSNRDNLAQTVDKKKLAYLEYANNPMADPNVGRALLSDIQNANTQLQALDTQLGGMIANPQIPGLDLSGLNMKQYLPQAPAIPEAVQPLQNSPMPAQDLNVSAIPDNPWADYGFDTLVAQGPPAQNMPAVSPLPQDLPQAEALPVAKPQADINSLNYWDQDLVDSRRAAVQKDTIIKTVPLGGGKSLMIATNPNNPLEPTMQVIDDPAYEYGFRSQEQQQAFNQKIAVENLDASNQQALADYKNQLATNNTPSTLAYQNNVLAALPKYVGYSYEKGANGENHKIDCSGLIYRTLNDAGVKVPDSTAEGYRNMFPPVADGLKPGDLVYFDLEGKGSATHAGIFNGNGTMTHAGSKGVQQVPLSNYWQSRMIGANRPTTATTNASSIPPGYKAVPGTLNTKGQITYDIVPENPPAPTRSLDKQTELNRIWDLNSPIIHSQYKAAKTQLKLTPQSAAALNAISGTTTFKKDQFVSKAQVKSIMDAQKKTFYPQSQGGWGESKPKAKPKSKPKVSGGSALPPGVRGK